MAVLYGNSNLVVLYRVNDAVNNGLGALRPCRYLECILNLLLACTIIIVIVAFLVCLRLNEGITCLRRNSGDLYTEEILSLIRSKVCAVEVCNY